MVEQLEDLGVATPERPAWAPPAEDMWREALLFTRVTIVDLEPNTLERVAAFLDALLHREPIKSGRGYANERIVLGCLVTDLRTMVMAAGEPVGVLRDLRDAKTKSDERSARQRMEFAFRAYDDQITEAIEEDRRARATTDRLSQDPEPAPVMPAPGDADGVLPTWS